MRANDRRRRLAPTLARSVLKAVIVARSLSSTCAVLVMLLALACGSTEEPVGSSCGNIYLGRPDEWRGGVAALLSYDGSLICSATAVGTSQGRPAYLTAAHCLDETLVGIAVGSDYAQPRRSFPVWTALAHPDFERSTGSLDLAVVVADTVSDAPSATFAYADDLRLDIAIGDQVRFVGYGSTDELPDSTLRRERVGRVAEVEPLQFSYQQHDGGPCFGDSGGPALVADASGLEWVVGVTSYGDDGCQSRGTSVRVAAAAQFIDSQLDSAPTGCGAPRSRQVSSRRVNARVPGLKPERSKQWKGYEENE